MAATQFVVNYSAITGGIRSITVFPEADEHDGHLASVNVGPGEKQICLPMVLYGNHLHVQPILNKITKLSQEGHSYDVFDAEGNYAHTLPHADPLGCGDGPPPGHTMISSVGALPGHKLVNGKVVKPGPLPQRDRSRA